MLITKPYLVRNICITPDFVSLEGEETLNDLANLRLMVCYSQVTSQATLPLAAQKQRSLINSIGSKTRSDHSTGRAVVPFSQAWVLHKGLIVTTTNQHRPLPLILQRYPANGPSRSAAGSRDLKPFIGSACLFDTATHNRDTLQHLQARTTVSCLCRIAQPLTGKPRVYDCQGLWLRTREDSGVPTNWLPVYLNNVSCVKAGKPATR